MAVTATWVKAYTSPTDSVPEYRNLERATVIRAVQDPAQSEATSLYYAQATIDGQDFFFLSLSGYSTAALCRTAIETLLVPS